MNSLDLIIIIPIAAGFVFGLFKGLIKELTSLAAIFLGIYGAKFFSPWLSDVLIKSFDFSAKTARPFAYLILFIAIAIALLILAKSLDKLFDSVSLGGLNKFMGGVFGGLKYALIISILINVFDVIDSKFSIISPETKSTSFAYQPMLKLAPKLWDEAKSISDKNKEEDNNE